MNDKGEADKEAEVKELMARKKGCEDVEKQGRTKVTQGVVQ